MEGTVKKASSSIQAEFNRIYVAQERIGKGGSGNYRIGQVALQAQDVAVQLQGGAKYAQVIAQQGSQIASIFGPTGAIIGGVLAIGAGLIGWAAAEEQAKKKAEDFNEALKEIQQTSDRASTQMYTNTEAVVGLEAKLRSGDRGQREVEIDRARNKELDETFGLMAHMVMLGNGMRDDEEEALINGVGLKYSAQSILAINERLETVMGKIADGEAAALGTAKGEIAMQKEMVTLEEQHLQRFAEREQQEEKSVKNAKELIDKAKQLQALAMKGLHGLFDQYGLEAQTKELAKQYLTAQKIATLASIQKANDLLDPSGAKAREKQKRREFIADRTIAEREINNLDRENGGLPGHHRLSPAERKAAVDARVRRAQAERNGKTKVSLDEADVVKLATAMMAAAAQQNAK